MRVDWDDKAPPAGEQAFFEELYQRYSRLMWDTARKYVSSQSDAEDVMQDALERLLRRLPRLMVVPRCALGTYVVYTVRSVAVNFMRHQAVVSSRTQPFADEEDCGEDVRDCPQEVLERREALRGLTEVWPLLSEDDRAILYGRYILDQTDEELAETFDCKPGTVRVKLTRARRRALKLMKGGEDA